MREIYILGTKVNDISLEETVSSIADFLLSENRGYITTPNPEICLLGYNNKSYRRIHLNSFVSIPDGYGLKLGARILGNKLVQTTTGADLCQEIIKLAEQNNYSILILGGKQSIGQRAINLIAQKYPRLKIKYLNGGNFDKEGNSDQDDIINKINEISPDIIFVCLGAPKQEYFIANNMEKLATKLMIGAGGSIDFIAGEIKRAPNLMRRLGLEWLWRLIHEPWRWKRILKAVIIFPLACLRWRFGNLFIYRKNVAGFIINHHKQIFLAKQTKTEEWKLPQGGAKSSRTDAEYTEAILREMKDELGTDRFEVIKMIKNCNKYKWPSHIRVLNKDKFVGQKQTLFLLKFNGQDTDIKLDQHEHTGWQWVNKNKIMEIAAPVRRSIIKIGLENFKDYL